MKRERREPEVLIGVSAAARLLGRSPQIVWHWAKKRRIRAVRSRPFKFRVADVLDAATRMPAPRPGWGRPAGTTDLRALARKVLGLDEGDA